MTDHPLLPGQLGYDDEGIPARPTVLIRDGILVGSLWPRQRFERRPSF